MENSNSNLNVTRKRIVKQVAKQAVPVPSIKDRLLAEKQKQEKQGALKAFNATAIDVGIPVVPHYPSLKGADGKTLKDDRGYAKKSNQTDGFSYTLAVFGQRQFVHLVLAKKMELTPASPYKVSGFGYDMGSNFYVKQEPRLINY